MSAGPSPPVIEMTPRPTDEYGYNALRLHVVVFGLTMTGLLALNLASHATWWMQWPFLGWGLGLTLHGVAVDHYQMRYGAKRRIRPDTGPVR